MSASAWHSSGAVRVAAGMFAWCAWPRNRCLWKWWLCAYLEHCREQRAAQVKNLFNSEPQIYTHSEEMLARKDIDGVMIATGDFQHAKLCAEVVRAGKDCYVEKPFANVLKEAKEARDAVKASKQVVQMGTQHRSQAYPLAVRDLVRTGRVGKVVQIEQNGM